MASYVVMEPAASDSRDIAARAVAVRDGFAFLAFLVPFLWFLWHRMWLEAAAALAVAFALAALGALPGTGILVPALSLLVSLFFGLEAQALRIACLARRGWHMWGVVEADNRDDAETRYLAETVMDTPAPAPAAPMKRSSADVRPRSAGPALGLLGYPGAR